MLLRFAAHALKGGHDVLPKSRDNPDRFAPAYDKRQM